jgi:sugar lactone lactonase YvrE
MSPPFTVARGDLGALGRDLHRPECVVPTAAGRIHVSDARGGITSIEADGSQTLLLGRGVPGFKPNGFSLLPDGAFAIANLGEEGGTWRLGVDGALTPEVVEVDGWRVPSTNFVHHERQGGEDRLWVSVSTRMVPRERAFDRAVADGVIILKDRRGTRIAADGLGFTNEVKVAPDGRHLYVNETVARRLSRLPIRADGGLGLRETVTEFSDGVFPDGFEFDAEGGIWIASVVSNRLLRVAPDGTQHIVLDDSDPEMVEKAERAWSEGKLGRADIDAGKHRELGNLASVTFGGPDLSTVFLGSLFAPSIRTFTSPIVGVEPPHWHY